MYDPDEIVLGPRYYAELEDSPIFQLSGLGGKLTRELRAEWDDRKYKETIAAYLGQISMIDHYLGKLFDHLKEQDLWENTCVIFLADHGDFNGAYGTFFKGLMLDASVKIPMIIKPAGGHGQKGVREELVNSIDVYGTILELAGDTEWKNLPQIESRSLLPLFEDENNASWKNEVYSIIGADPESNLSMLRSGPLKIIRRAVKNGEPIYELYDLGKDPFETRNFYGHDEYLDNGEELRTQLDTWAEIQAERYPEELDNSYKIWVDE